MYFDFEDYHPSIEPVGRALTGLEMVLLTIIFHLLTVILVLVSPKWLPRYLPKFLQTIPAPIVQQARDTVERDARRNRENGAACRDTQPLDAPYVRRQRLTQVISRSA